MSRVLLLSLGAVAIVVTAGINGKTDERETSADDKVQVLVQRVQELESRIAILEAQIADPPRCINAACWDGNLCEPLLPALPDVNFESWRRPNFQILPVRYLTPGEMGFLPADVDAVLPLSTIRRLFDGSPADSPFVDCAGERKELRPLFRRAHVSAPNF